MKKLLPAGLFLAAAAVLLLTCRQPKAVTAKKPAQTVLAQADSFSQFITTIFLPAVKTQNTSTRQLQSIFLQARLAYKKFEWAAEYFTPASAKLINGAPVPGFEEGQVTVPQGLQVIEGFLYPADDTANREALIKQLELLPSACKELEAYFKNIEVLDWQVFDAAKLEVFRVETLGITGFDAPLAESSMEEAACSLASLQNIINNYDKGGIVQQPFNAATAYLHKNTAFNTFNRAEFITDYANQLTTGLTTLEKALHIPAMQYSRLLRQDAATLFDSAAFDASAYAPGTRYTQTAQQTALGEKLFNDPILSGPLVRSCASCHNPANAFMDGLVKTKNITGKGSVDRNTPTLLNAALQPALFYDMRVLTLEDQVMDVVQNKREMSGSIPDITGRLWKNKEYRQLFTEAFPETDRTTIDTTEIAHAIAAYIRSLVVLDSRFDQYMRGNKTAMTAQEVTGFNLFMGKAKCGTCHYMPLFNGTLPPNYMITEPEVIGVPALGNKEVDPDIGRLGIVNAGFYRYAFKTPTIRNAARTAPYMHNGVFKTLEEVIDFYNKGGGQGMGLNVANQTLAPDKLLLDSVEIRDLISFITCLNSKRY